MGGKLSAPGVVGVCGFSPAGRLAREERDAPRAQGFEIKVGRVVSHTPLLGLLSRGVK